MTEPDEPNPPGYGSLVLQAGFQQGSEVQFVRFRLLRCLDCFALVSTEDADEHGEWHHRRQV